MSLQKLIDFGIIPIDSFEVSSNEVGFEAIKVFDGNLSTSWKPSVNQPNSWYKVNFLDPHLVKAFDIAFGKGDKRKHTFTVEALVDNNRWIKINTYETKGNTLEPVRVNIPDILAKSVKLTYKSYEEIAGHMGTIPEVSELRFYGVIDEDEAPKMPELGCPEGYGLDVSTGKCIKDVQFQILVPDSITPEGATSTEGNVDALLDLATDIAFTINGKNSKLVEKFNNPVNVNAIIIEIENKGQEYNLIVNIPNQSQTPVIIQKGISQTSFVLDQTVTTDSIELISNNDSLTLIDFYGLGSKGKKKEEPIDPSTKLDAQGVKMIYAPKQGGQVVTAKDTYQKESTHNTGPRTSLYSTIEYTANSGELTEGFIMKLSDNGEQNAPKLLSGGHTGSGNNNETKQGQCYAVGVNQNGSLHLAKEYPYHPSTPKAYDKIQYLDQAWKNLGNLKGKFVLMKIIYYPKGPKTMHIEWWFDKKALETGKLENDWVQMAYVDDDGTWGSKYGPAHMINNGIKYKGKVLGFYVRIDQKQEPVKFSFQGQHEIGENPTKLV